MITQVKDRNVLNPMTKLENTFLCGQETFSKWLVIQLKKENKDFISDDVPTEI